MAQKVKFVSPKGRAKYPWLNKPDTQFSPEGVFKTSLILEDSKAFIKQLQDIAKEEFGPKAKTKLPFDTDEETGETFIKVKSKYQPKFYDSTGQILTGSQVPNLWGGSVMKVGGFITTYQVSGQKGISLQLTKVQIIEPVTSGDDSGFDSVEGGFVATEEDSFDDVPTEKVAQGHEEEADRF